MTAVCRMTCADCGQPTGKRYARYCDAHRWRHRGKPATYRLTPERVAYLKAHYRPSERGMSRRIAAVLQVPKWRVCAWASELGLTNGTYRTGPAWTAAEDAFLETHLGSRHVNWIAKQLGRSTGAVTGRVKRLSLSRLVDHGYSARQVADGFGVDQSTVIRWIERGWLTATRHTQNGGPYRTYGVTLDAIHTFVKQHSAAFVLAKVDQVWFLDLVFNGALGTKSEAA